jgi:two-component system OmpR family sensor kinase
VALLTAGGIYLTVEQEFNEVFDYELKQVALSFREDSLGAVIPPPLVEQEDDLIIQVWDGGGRLVYLSDKLPVLPPRAESGFSNVSASESSWRVFNIRSHGHVVQVAQPTAVRRELAAVAAARTLIPMLFLVAALGIVIWVIIGRGLRPLVEVADAVEQRSAFALQPLPDGGLPGEVRPLVTALNHLLGRLAKALEIQRIFIADAAHELRTPLTAVQLQIQLARRAGTPEERDIALTQLDAGVRRAIHLVQQLLTLARVEPDVAAHSTAPVDIAELARHVVAEHASLAQAKDIDLGVEGGREIWISGDAEALRTMLGNLIDNAIRYVHRGGKIDVCVDAQDHQAVLTVTDNGPGIPVEFRERAFDRFFRREGSGEIGSGLGLAIVKSVVVRHHATVALQSSDQQRGLRVMVRFPDPQGGHA